MYISGFSVKRDLLKILLVVDFHAFIADECRNADGIFVGEKCEHFFRLNVCIGFRVSSTFGQSDGCMSDTPETMGGLSGVPNGTSSQTSASRGYVLFRGANKGHTRRSYKLSPGCGHDPRSAPNLERHGIRCKHSAGRNAHIFLQRIFHLHFHMKSRSVF